MTGVATPEKTLRQVRLDRGLSLSGLEGKTGLNRGTLSQIERGVRVPSAVELARILDGLDLSPDRVRVAVVLLIQEGS